METGASVAQYLMKYKALLIECRAFLACAYSSSNSIQTHTFSLSLSQAPAKDKQDEPIASSPSHVQLRVYDLGFRV